MACKEDLECQSGLCYKNKCRRKDEDLNNDTSDDTPSGNNNIALVIGIATGAIVLIAILVCLIMRKKKSVKLQKDLEKQNTLLEEVQLD